MKYNDHGFIFYYDDYIQLQLLNFGNLVLDLSIYKDKICTNKFQCIAAEKFNKKYINESYEQSFLYDLFRNKNINYQDKKNHILIKAIKGNK
jgi:hypothetical protein